MFRRTLVQSFLFKFYAYVCSELRQTLVDSAQLSIVHPYNRPISHGEQTIPERPLSQKVVGSSLPHRSAYLHTTGEAIYTNDIQSLAGTLHAALVLTTKPNARIKHIGENFFILMFFFQTCPHIDIGDASQVPGFVSFVNYMDVPGSNKTGVIDKTKSLVYDEEVFISSISPCIGAIIGVVVCESEQSAQVASNLVRIEYELLTPTIFTIEDAITYESYFGKELCLRQGDAIRSLIDAEHKLEGTLLIGGQEHFYLETHCCMVIPSNDDQEVILYLSTQKPTAVQESTALALGRDASHITCHVKRIGGAFGGKGSRSYVIHLFFIVLVLLLHFAE